MAIPQDAYTLQAELNTALAELQAAGVVTQLIEEYLGIDADLLPPISTPVPGQPTPTPVPPSGCINAMAYVADLSYDDQNFSNIPQLPPGTPFQKGWKVRNTGTCTWDNGYSLVPVKGNNPAARMGGVPTPIQGIVSPGQTYDFWVNLTSPLNAGTYVEYWTMRQPTSDPFRSSDVGGHYRTGRSNADASGDTNTVGRYRFHGRSRSHQPGSMFNPELDITKCQSCLRLSARGKVAGLWRARNRGTGGLSPSNGNL